MCITRSQYKSDREFVDALIKSNEQHAARIAEWTEQNKNATPEQIANYDVPNATFIADRQKFLEEDRAIVALFESKLANGVELTNEVVDDVYAQVYGADDLTALVASLTPVATPTSEPATV